jgi:hypothetical protein
LALRLDSFSPLLIAPLDPPLSGGKSARAIAAAGPICLPVGRGRRSVS